jgi:predicted nucleic acid-binding protein
MYTIKAVTIDDATKFVVINKLTKKEVISFDKYSDAVDYVIERNK